MESLEELVLELELELESVLVSVPELELELVRHILQSLARVLSHRLRPVPLFFLC